MATKTSKISKTNQELMSKLGETREALRALRFGTAGSKTNNVKLGRALRREVAQLLTQIHADRK